jgi:hypothetical protein
VERPAGRERVISKGLLIGHISKANLLRARGASTASGGGLSIGRAHAQSHHDCLRICAGAGGCVLWVKFGPSSSHAAVTQCRRSMSLNLKADAARLPDRTFKEGY